jgi:hypothetical protein
MNRLVIIGNGFDLAHGLPTGYCDFIDDYWRNVILNFDEKVNKSNYSDGLIDISYEFMWDAFDGAKIKLEQIKSYRDFAAFIGEYSAGFNRYQYNDKNECRIKFKNEFFRVISNVSVQNWVDIENEYYKLLKRCLKNELSIIELNKQFDEVKLLLEKYLINNIEDKYELSLDIIKGMIYLFEDKSYNGNELLEFFKEISKKGERILEEAYQVFLVNAYGVRNPHNNISEVKILNTFLSFNYTSTMSSYLNILGTKSEFLNEIHGSILDKSNPINFGFGDEMDNHYKQIEEINDNEYLKNIKSFQYLHTPNYKRLLDLIDSGVFQVYIMGHSCGLSDRTLLNTIFEHENCCSIKIFYHQKEDGSDNYTEITQNVSRHFNKKALMRERIVNKTLCQPLPQIQLPKKQNDPLP